MHDGTIAVDTSRFTIKLPLPFELPLVVCSHGWYSLPPMRWDAGAGELALSFEVAKRTPVTVRVRQRGDVLRGRVDSFRALTAPEKRAARGAVARCLRLDAELGEFHALAVEDERVAWAAERGAGRILRSPTTYEDLIKVLCTTNCSWALTQAMVGKLVDALGVEAPGGKTFPSPAAMARRDEAFYRDTIRAGYRAAYLRQLATATHSGAIDPEAWAAVDDVAALRARLLALPGIGPYAAAHLLRISGHYDDHGIDSWCRATFQRIYGLAKPPTDARIVRRYRRFGRWLGLALWMDLTREWHVR